MTPPSGADTKALVALVATPWSLVDMPSIQLATLEASLRSAGIDAEVHELYLDFAARIGVARYRELAPLLTGALIESVFSQHYFDTETETLTTHLRQALPDQSLAVMFDGTYESVARKARDFLDEMLREIDWSRYDIVGFTLGINQTGSSLALARWLKRAHPHLRIVFGGSACAGSAGTALARISPEVDVVVRTEGEDVLPLLVRCLRTGASLEELPGLSFRREDGSIAITPNGPLYHRRDGVAPLLQYDRYYHRAVALGIREQLDIWLPFESSRGCWYGEKTQCTFCGLHEIMKSREWDPDSVLQQLRYWSERHGAQRFFAVDLIIPRGFFDTFLARLAEEKTGWTFFYEIKANITRAQVKRLAEAGVRWVQPGIESLDRGVLELMRKGAQPYHNVQLLKWAREYGIEATWSVILGTPGEDPAAYEHMARMMRRLFHLPPPPKTKNTFWLNRFSPYETDPASFGIYDIRPSKLYALAFPLPQDVLSELVYELEYRIAGRTADPLEYVRPMNAVIEEWTQRHQVASLVIHPAPDGSAVIKDQRYAKPAEYKLAPAEAALYAFLDSARLESRLQSSFAAKYPKEADALAASGGIDQVLTLWDDAGLVLRDGGRVLALATYEQDLVPASEPAAPRKLKWWPIEEHHAGDELEVHTTSQELVPLQRLPRASHEDALELPPGASARRLRRGDLSVVLLLERGSAQQALAQALGHRLSYFGPNIPQALNPLVLTLGRAFGRLPNRPMTTEQVWGVLMQVLHRIDPVAKLEVLEASSSTSSQRS